jgi:hypothetical protein
VSDARRILVVGYAAERTVAYTVERIHARARPVALLDIATYLHHATVHPDAGEPGGYRVDIDGEPFSFERCTGAYVRAIDLRELRRRVALKLAVLEHVLSSLPIPVVNRPGYGRSNASKPGQLLRLRECGFLVPESCSTNMADAPGLAARLERGELVYKSNSSMRSVVARGGAEEARRLPDLVNCPVLFQQYIAGPDVRVHLVGNRVFAQEIRSEAVDYRYPALFDVVRYRPIDVPDAIQRLCAAFRAREGLTFIGFDFKVDREGRWYCLEANPMPGYDGFDERLGGRLSSALIDELWGA